MATCSSLTFCNVEPYTCAVLAGRNGLAKDDLLEFPNSRTSSFASGQPSVLQRLDALLGVVLDPVNDTIDRIGFHQIGVTRLTAH
jgi:hypothetical protein